MLGKGLLPLLLALAVPLCGRADPATEAETKRIEAALGRIQQAQASLYQQFQMAQELRRNALDALAGFGERALRLRQIADFIVLRKF